MKTLKIILTLTVISFILFAFGMTDDSIKGWFNSGSVQMSYKTVLDNNVYHSGQRSVRIESEDISQNLIKFPARNADDNPVQENNKLSR